MQNQSIFTSALKLMDPAVSILIHTCIDVSIQGVSTENSRTGL